MNSFSWVLLGGAVVAAAVAIDAGSHLALAVPAGAAAVLLVSVVGATELQSQSSEFAPDSERAGASGLPEQTESDSLLRLRRAFRTGEMGRTLILATIHSLERDLEPTGRTPLSIEEERAALRLPPEQFRRWVDDRLTRIEAAS
jgi:hypothetical protein